MNSGFLAPAVIQFSGFELDLTNQCLWRLDSQNPQDPQGATRIELPPKAFAVLRQLVEHSQQLMTTKALLDAVWPDVYVLPEALKAHIAVIRRALGDEVAQPRFIETQRGQGYRFIAAMDAASSAALSGFTASRTDRFVGRATERQALRTALQRARAGITQRVFMSGEAGMGKTALIHECLGEYFAGRSGDSVCVLSGECVEGYGGIEGSSEPFYPLLQGLGRLCRSAAGTAITQTLITVAPTWAVLLSAYVPAHIRESLYARTLGAGRDRMLREICELLEVLASDRLVLLVLEDLHWADFSTIEVLSALARRGVQAQMMTIATFRRDIAAAIQHPIVALSDALLLQGACEVLELAPLPQAAIGAWLTHGTAPNPLDEELAHFVAERCGGNPLFMQAMLEHLHEQGRVRKTADGWQQAAPSAQLRDVLPRTIAQVIEARVGLLSRDTQRALEAASVVGMTFDVTMVAEAAQMPAGTVEDLCDEAARVGQFICRARTDERYEGAVQLFRFTHALVRSVFYERQGMLRRSRSHLLTGERLEALYPAAERGCIASELCRHFADARQWDKALDYVRIALQTAKVRHAYREALAILDQADMLLARLPQDARAARRLEFLETRAALYAAAHDPQAVACYEELNQQAAGLGKTGVQLRALPGLSYVLSWSDQARSLACLDDAQRLSAACPDRRISALTQVICSVRRVWTRGWSADDARDCAAALDLLRETADGISIAKAQLDYCMLLMVSTQYRKALNLTQTSYQVLYDHAVGHPGFDVSRGLWMLRLGVPWAQLSLGEFGRSLNSFDLGIQQFHENGNYFAARTLQIYRGWLLVHTMDFETVLELDSEFRAAAQRPASGAQARERAAFLPPQQRVWTTLAGLAHAGLNQRKQAAARFAEAEQQMEHEPIMFDWYWRLAIEWGSANLALANDEAAVAARHATRFLERALATDERTWQALAWETAARVALQAGDLESARVRIDAAFAARDGFETPLADWRLHLTAARLHEALGGAQEAAIARQRGVELRKRLAASIRSGSRFGARLADVNAATRAATH